MSVLKCENYVEGYCTKHCNTINLDCTVNNRKVHSICCLNCALRNKSCYCSTVANLVEIWLC